MPENSGVINKNNYKKAKITIPDGAYFKLSCNREGTRHLATGEVLPITAISEIYRNDNGEPVPSGTVWKPTKNSLHSKEKEGK